MKKVTHLFSFLIAFLFGGIIYPLTVKAEALPTVSSPTFDVITTTSESFYQLGLVEQGLSPYSDAFFSTWNPWSAGAVLLNFDLEDCNITELGDREKSALLDSYSIIDTNNLSVTVNTPIYSVEFDNGYFTGYCYVDENGNLLSYTNDLGGHLLQLKFGGSIKSSSDWQNLFESTATKIYESNMIYYDNYNGGTLPDVSYYIMQGLKSGGDPYIIELYIPNQYEKGVCVPVSWSSQGNRIYRWYCNGTPYMFSQIWGNVHSTDYDFQVVNGTFTRDGISYTKQITCNFGNNGPADNTYANWVSGADRSHYTLAHSGYAYNSNLASSVADVSTSAFKKIQYPESAEIINYNYYYDPTEIARLEQEINNLTQTVNSNYNNQQSISENNFPFYYPLNNPQSTPSQIPFPNVNNYPGFNPFPSNVPTSDPSVNPSIENLDQQIDPTGITNNIPIISGLQNKFPFSIPWDIYNLIKGLSVPREIPVLEWEIEIPIIEYTWNPTIDLTMYDSTATLFRTLFLITFIIGLAIFSYNHFFGQ